MTEPATPPGIQSIEPALPPDWRERGRALDPTQSFLVQAPAGSGKTYLLTQRFLRLLGQAERPGEIVAITFTNAAAAEMRNRVLEALEKAESKSSLRPENESASLPADPDSLESLAHRALAHSRRMGWRILDLPGQLRITTIDAFCRGLALRSPLSWGTLAGLGGRLEPAENPRQAYKLAARRTLETIASGDASARLPVEALLRWRDNNWHDAEDLLVKMLQQRNRWFQDFVFERGIDWRALRARLEAPFARAASQRLKALCRILDRLEGCREFALELARFARRNGGKSVPLSLAERAELPTAFESTELDEFALEDAIAAYRGLAGFLLTGSGTWRKKGGLNVHYGFPATAEGRAAKDRFGGLVESLAIEPGLETALAAFLQPLPVRYEEPEWELIRHCFAVLRTAAAHLQLVFAETGAVDFTEVAQIALRVLSAEDGYPSDLAQREADSIRHLLVDEFQDTSRNQHELLSRLIAAWPGREGRTCFCVGDPMQSIYGFRDAEVELFERLKTHGLETASSDPDSPPFRFEFVSLRANFRTVPSLIADLNTRLAQIFEPNEAPDAAPVRFTPAEAARHSPSTAKTGLHLAFTAAASEAAPAEAAPEATQAAQLAEMTALIRGKLQEATQAGLVRYRIAVLARARKSLVPIAEALRTAGIAFRAIQVVKLNERPEVADALALARALLHPEDRTAWLGILRAPWCGLSLAELHALVSSDDPAIAATPVSKLLETRLAELHAQGRIDSRAFAAADRVGRLLRQAQAGRAASMGTLGSWVASVWRSLGGADTVDRAQTENLHVLWAALDSLPEGEPDLLGPALAAALDELYATPGPAAGASFGVQLMTIHQSKGLEFELVLVPDLEARGQLGQYELISWLERGLAEPGPNGEIGEFLIAPINTRGGETGAAKRWVDSVKQQRERLELRRLFYVAATRARDELHLFARPQFGWNRDRGEAVLAAPQGLLKTAWPALQPEVETAFAAWSAGLASLESPLQLAASAAGNLPAMPTPPAPAATLRRLPADYRAPERNSQGARGAPADNASGESGALFDRSEGGLEARLLGTALHAFLERLTRLRQTAAPEAAAHALHAELAGIAALLRGGGLARTHAERLASRALAVARRAAVDPAGAWIASPHPGAETETRWTGITHGGVARVLRPDRVFFAPPPDLSGSNDPPVWWIVDYKSDSRLPGNESDPVAASAWAIAQRGRYAPQLQAYAQALRGLLGQPDLGIRAGLYYPQLLLWDHWAC